LNKLKPQNFILGAGINGLISAFYLHNYKVIGFTTEAQDNQRFSLGIRLLHKSREMKKLLESLGLSTETRKIKVGYYYEDRLHKTVTPRLMVEYFNKTRAFNGFFKSAMSGGKNNYEVFEVTMAELYNTLMEKVKDRITEERVTKIDLLRREIQLIDGKILLFNKMVNTLPAPVFYNLAGMDLVAKRFKALPKTFHTTNKFMDLGDYDYVYFPEKNDPIHRITNLEYGFVVEGNLAETDIKIEDTIIINNAQIASDRKAISPLIDIRFIGRYATWDHGKKVNEVIRDVKGLCD